MFLDLNNLHSSKYLKVVWQINLIDDRNKIQMIWRFTHFILNGLIYNYVDSISCYYMSILWDMSKTVDFNAEVEKYYNTHDAMCKYRSRDTYLQIKANRKIIYHRSYLSDLVANVVLSNKAD